jgi:hypothetical protein
VLHWSFVNKDLRKYDRAWKIINELCFVDEGLNIVTRLSVSLDGFLTDDRIYWIL